MKRVWKIAGLVGTLLSSVSGAFAQELSFWTWRQEDRVQYEKFIGAFEAANPGIKVKLQTFEAQNYNTVLSTALAGGTGPDLMMARAYGGVETVAKAGYFMPLDSTKVPALKDFDPAALAAETMRSDKTLYAVPFASQTMLVVYNKEIFAKHGITEPQSWDELVAASKKLKAAEIIPFANGTATAWQNETIVSALVSSVMGKSFYDDLMAGKADFTDPRYTGALGKLKEISAYFPEGFIGLDYASAQQLFSSGMAAMFAGGSFQVSAFLQQNPKLKMDVFAAPGLKAEDPKLVGLYFDGGYAGNAKTKHPEAVLKFLNFTASKEFGQAFANELSNISAVPGVAFNDPVLQKVAQLNKSSIPYIMLVHFRYQEPTGSVLLQAETQKMLSGQATPEQAGAAVTKGLAGWYAGFKK